MPDNDTLEAQLLRRATSIGPDKPQVIGAPEPPEDKFENQQPDILSMLINAGGLNDVSGGTPGISPAMTPMAGTLASKATGDMIPKVAEEAQLTRWAPVQKLLGMFREFNPTPEDAAQTVMRTLAGDKATSFRVPEPTPIKSPVPQMEIPRQIDAREPSIVQRLEAQRKADAQIKATPQTPIQNNAGATGEARWNIGKGSARVTPEIVKEIRALAAEGKLFSVIAKRYPQLKETSIKDIIRRYSWAWVK